MEAASAAINGAAKTATTSQAYLEGSKVKETKALITELCRHFYHLGWVSGTGGSITIKVHDDAVPKPQQLIVMSPSGAYLQFRHMGFMFLKIRFLWLIVSWVL